MKQYNVYRYSQNSYPRLIKHGLSIVEATELCSDPETSSLTARKPKGCDGDEAMIQRWHNTNKHWFYGFEEARG